MAKEKQIPKYVLNLLEQRRSLAERLTKVSCKVDEYCYAIGIDVDAIDDACICSSIMITTEPTSAYQITVRAIERHLNGQDMPSAESGWSR